MAPHPPRKLGTFSSGEGSSTCRNANVKAFSCEGARKRGMPAASPSGDRYLKSLPRARGRGTALAVDEVLKPHYFSECDLKCTMRLRTQNKNHTISKPLFQACPKQCLDFEKLCTYFAAFLFAHSSSKTGTKLNLATLSPGGTSSASQARHLPLMEKAPARAGPQAQSFSLGRSLRPIGFRGYLISGIAKTAPEGFYFLPGLSFRGFTPRFFIFAFSARIRRGFSRGVRIPDRASFCC